jgi:HEAT repeat protein
MDLRTHIWGASTTGVLIVVGAVAALVWLRPLPNRSEAAHQRITATWEAHERGDLSADAAAMALAKLATAGPGFGESRGDGDAYRQVQQQAIHHLGRLEGHTAFNALCTLALHEDRDINLDAVQALRRRGDKAAIPTLLATLAHDDRRQKRLDDHFVRVTQETLRAIRELADTRALLQLREFVESDRRMFEQDIRRTIALIAADLEATPTLRDSGSSLADLDSLLSPDPGRLGASPLFGDSLSQPVRLNDPIILTPGEIE